MKSIEFNSIFMGNTVRYIAKANIDGKVYSKLLSLNESKYFSLLNQNEKINFANKLFLTEEKVQVPEISNEIFENPLKEALYQVDWKKGNRTHTTVIKANSERIAIERIHNQGGDVLTLQEIGNGNSNTYKKAAGVYESVNNNIKRFKKFLKTN